MLITATALTWTYLNSSRLKKEWVIGVLLLVDIALFTFVLHLFGGHTNPFSTSYIAFVALAGFSLTSTWTWAIALSSSLGFFSLFFTGDHQSHSMHNHSEAFDSHLQGMVFSLLLTSSLIAFFSSRLKRALLEKERELFDTRAREQRLASLTTLAAGAAHELATPLATTLIIAKDLENELKDRQASDLALECRDLIAGVERAKTILDNMSGKAGAIQGEVSQEILLLELIENVICDVNAHDRLKVVTIAPSELVRAPLRALTFILSALIRNGIEASIDVVTLEARCSNNLLSFRIRDRGHGIPESIRPRLGEPFLTTKEPGQGMGLGIYLAYLFAQQTGGTIEFLHHENGTEVILGVPQFKP